MFIRSICICDHDCNSFWRSPVHLQSISKTLPVLSIVQSIRGSYRVALGDEPACETGHMGVFIAPSQVAQHITHIAAEDGTMDAQWIFLDIEINRLYKLDDLYSFPTILPAHYNEEICSILTSIRSDPSIIKHLQPLDRLVEILFENATPKSKIHEESARLKSYIANHYMEPITIEDLMRVLHCSRSAMYRLFREDFGESPSQYINRVRIHHAQLLLSNTARSISEIALAVGFPDACYFSRVFSRITGKGPRSYREMNTI